MVLTIDIFIAVFRVTIFHPIASLFLLAAIAVSQETCWPKEISSNFLAHKWNWPLSMRLKMALGCVVVSWLLQWNRILNRKALNPTPKMSCSLHKEIAVVTGGSGPVGRELVRKLERLGATVAIMDMVPPPTETGTRTRYFKVDVASFDNVQSTYNNIVVQLGVPTILVANAGIVRGKSIIDASEKDLQTTFDVNVLGVLFCIKSFLPPMIVANRGHVLVTSSVTAFNPCAGVVDYSASKEAVTAVVEGLQTEMNHKYGNPSVKISAISSATVAN